jgi:LacI family transcriptional regulator
LSVPTVSKVLNGRGSLSRETRERVRAAADEMGYVANFMASQIRRNKSSIVGMVMSDLSQPFFSQVLMAGEAALEAEGYRAMWFTSFENEQKEYDAVRQLASLGAAGCIIDLSQNTRDAVPFLRSSDMPYVLMGRRLLSEEDCFVGADNRLAGREATAHLISRKPGRPAVCVNGPSGISPTTDRYEGFLDALREAGAPPGQVYENCYGLEDGYRAGLDAARRVEAPFSAFCSTDRIAQGFIRGLWEGGLRVPKDVSVAGVDDIESAGYMTPSLTTLALPKREMAEKSVEMLIQTISGEKPEPSRILLRGQLIVRESS